MVPKETAVHTVQTRQKEADYRTVRGGKGGERVIGALASKTTVILLLFHFLISQSEFVSAFMGHDYTSFE